MKNKSFLFFSITIAITAAILLALSGAVLYRLYRTKTAGQTKSTSTQVSPTPEESLPTPTPTPQANDAELIKQTMAEKYNKQLAEVDLTVQNNTGTYAKGGVKFSGEIGGGWWLAAKEEGGWIIAADGNGTVMCADIEPYNFPTSMVPECWDEATSQLISR